MPTKPAVYRPTHTKVRQRDTRESAAKRGYGHIWREYQRKPFLHNNPLCVECELKGRFVIATVVDHIIPHKGDDQKFNDQANWQALCKACHDRKTASEQK